MADRGGAAETQSPVQATTEELATGEELVQVLGESIADAAIESAEAAEGPRSTIGKWTSADSALAVFLAVNMVFMLALVLSTEPRTDPVPEEPGAVQGEVPSGREGDAPVRPKNILWARAEDLAEQGKVEEAVGVLEQMLREDESITGVLRRSVYLKLSYYCGLLGGDRIKDADHYFRLASSGFERGLLPEDLWRLSEEAFGFGDYVQARRYNARFLLQESLLTSEQLMTVPLAYLRMADGYRQQSKEEKKQKKKEKKGEADPGSETSGEGDK
ncbi:MAG: hypothetical protein ACE5F1_05475 [Planctomycetota bacterium]